MKNCLVAAGPHHGSLRNLRFKVSVSVPKKNPPRDGSRPFSGHRPTTCRWSGGASCFRCQPSPGWYLPSARCRYPTNMSICWSWWFDWIALYGRQLFALTGKVLDSLAFHQGLEVCWKSFCPCRSVGAYSGVNTKLWAFAQSRRDCLGVLGVDRDRPGELEKYLNHLKTIPDSAVIFGDTLHINQFGLPLSIDPRHIGMGSGKPTARWIVQRINQLPF